MGGGLGALTGGLISHTPTGALIGAAVGAVGGAAIGAGTTPKPKTCTAYDANGKAREGRLLSLAAKVRAASAARDRLLHVQEESSTFKKKRGRQTGALFVLRVAGSASVTASPSPATLAACTYSAR